MFSERMHHRNSGAWFGSLRFVIRLFHTGCDVRNFFSSDWMRVVMIVCLVECGFQALRYCGLIDQSIVTIDFQFNVVRQDDFAL